MNRLEKRLTELLAKKEKAVILFITAGDPDMNSTLNIMKSMAENGADCIELGVPFSDPIADGPVIQRASIRALKNKVNVDDIFKTIKSFRTEYDTPVVMMGYFNTFLQYGLEKFADKYNKVGGDALIIADLPYEEGEEFEEICKSKQINLIYLLAPGPGSDRTRKILAASSGFVYFVSHYGTTGVDQDVQMAVGEDILSIKSMTELPVMVGFGISSVKKAQTAATKADGVIIGSWLIQELEKNNFNPEIAGKFVKELKTAL